MADRGGIVDSPEVVNPIAAVADFAATAARNWVEDKGAAAVGEDEIRYWPRCPAFAAQTAAERCTRRVLRHLSAHLWTHLH